ncbi:hypothetical protein [Microvirga ossetica]|uniref:hypothetical protein n=1 Tax=Microvirga ossetica TaxID=1882682 RepID=UPI0012FFD2F1|nr:hypothetical protein [Microvirga ossetica]
MTEYSWCSSGCGNGNDISFLFIISGVAIVCSEVRMRTKYTPVFAIALVLGWWGPDDRQQPSFGISAEAKVKSRVSETTKKPQRMVRKSAPRKAITKRAVAPPKPIVVTQVPSPSSSPTLDFPVPPIPPIMIFPPPELQAPTREHQMEKLRRGLLRLAKTYPTPEDHMERLRVGLENLARAMNNRGSEIIAQR